MLEQTHPWFTATWPRLTGTHFFKTRFRRAITVPALIVAAVLLTVTFPLLLIVALVIDARRGSLTTVRLLCLVLCFLLIDTASLIVLGFLAVLTEGGSPRRIAATYAFEKFYTSSLLRSVTAVFRLRYDIEGEELVDGGPVIVFMRHASVLDVLLPGGLVTARHGVRLRYVLKRELLVDPVFDIAGHWVPNCFVSRSHAAAHREIAEIRALKDGLGARDGVIIYPEGTRFTEAKRLRALQRLRNDPVALEQARRLRHVLPVHPGGPLALLEGEPECDVLFLGHHGFEGLSTVKEIWRRQPSARTIRVRFWREPASSVPRDAEARREWLSERWQRLDDWLDAAEITSPLS